MEPGLYVTFFSKDEPASRELPPVGPLDNVVLRQHVLLAERRSVQQAQELGVAIDRWLEAELEMQRATGEEPGGTKRPERRFSARDGVYLRFAVFGDPHEHDLVPDLGPFAVVVVGPLSIEADGVTLATRTVSAISAWELAPAAGDEVVGLHKPDVAFRTSNTTYHSSITPAEQSAVASPLRPTPSPPVVEALPPLPVPPRDVQPFELPPLERTSREIPPPSEPVMTPPPRSEMLFTDRPRTPNEIYSVAGPAAPSPHAESPLTSGDREMIDQLDRDRSYETLRARLQSEERKRLGVGEQGASATSFAMRYRAQTADESDGADDGEAGREWGAALWRLRFAVIGVLVVLASAYTFVTLRGGISFGPSGAQLRYVGLAQRITGAHWEYTVNAVQSSRTSGTATASGTFYIVRLAVANVAGEGQQLSPSSFSLIDANGGRHGPEGVNSGVYAPGSGIVWPITYPMGRAVSVPIVFDVDPSLPKGMLLVIDEMPDLRVRLD